MSDDIYSVRIVYDGPKGKLALTEDGIGFLKALLMRLICDAENGMSAALEMGRSSDHAYIRGQADYFRHAASFLTGALTTLPMRKLSLGESLKLLALWPDDDKVPDRWTYLHQEYLSTGAHHVDLLTDSGGSGGCGECLPEPVGASGRPTPDGAGDPGSDGRDPPKGRRRAVRQRPTTGEADRRGEPGGTASRGPARQRGRKKAPPE